MHDDKLIRGNLSLHELFLLCVKLNIFRLVKPHEDEKSISITICGVYKIKKNKSNGAILFYKISRDKFYKVVWLRTTKIPVNISLFWSRQDNFAMNDWLSFAIKEVINCVIKAGFSICDNAYCYQVRAWRKEEEVITTFYPDDLEREYQMEYAKPIGRRELGYPLKEQNLGIDNTTLLNEIVRKIDGRSLTFAGFHIREAAAKLLTKEIWTMVDKDTFSLYAKSHHSSMNHYPITQASFNKYHVFTKNVNIENGLDYGGLWVFVDLLCRQNKKNKIELTGKTKEFFNMLKLPDDVSLGDFKSLRYMKPSLVTAIKDTILRRDCTSQVKTLIKILRSPHIKCYPVTVIYWLMEYLEGNFRPEQAENIYRVCDKWLGYHRELYRNIGFKSQERRWRNEVNQIQHVIDWLIRREPTLHKNQEWHSFWRLADEWTHEVNVQNAQYDEAIHTFVESWVGTGVNWIIPGVIEITTYAVIKQEGQDMQHCVASYAWQCASGEYVVFSLMMSNGNERATLGLSRNVNDKTYRLDQIRGPNNYSVSKEMALLGKKVLNKLNSFIKSCGKQ